MEKKKLKVFVISIFIFIMLFSKEVYGFKIIDDLKKNFFGTLISLALDVPRTIYGDFPQFVGNMIQTSTDHTFFNWQYMYSRKELEKDGNENVNKYVQIGDSEEGGGEDWQKVIDIKKEDDNDSRFDEDTEIPVVAADLYNVASGKISFLDVNFLTGNQYHDDGSPWMILRNFAAGLIHIALYISGAILVVTLILYGIQIVRHSYDNPEEEAEYKKKLEDFVKSVAILIGSIVIMGLCIFGSNALLWNGDNNSDTELPIRVNVEPAGYSFSTTATGYARYMASNENVDEWVQKLLYTIEYIVLVHINLFVVILMLIRMFVLWGLSIIGPITAALNALGVESRMSFKTWVISYVSISAIQWVLSLGYVFVLNFTIK